MTENVIEFAPAAERAAQSLMVKEKVESMEYGSTEEPPSVDSAEEDHETWWKEAVKKSEELILQTDHPAPVLFLITNIIDDMLRFGVPASVLMMAVQEGFSFNEERSNGTE